MATPTLHEFGRTELLVTQEDAIVGYHERFSNGPVAPEPVPAHFRIVINHSKIHWDPKRYVEPMFAEEWDEILADLSPSEATKRRQGVVIKYQLKSGQEMIDVDLGTIWVGRLSGE